MEKDKQTITKQIDEESLKDFKLSFEQLKEQLLKYNCKSEYSQAAIVILRNIFKLEETKVEQMKEESLKSQQKNLVRDNQSLGKDGYIILNHYLSADVKKAVLDLKEVIYNTANDEFGHNENPNYEEVLTYVLKHIDERFGVFEK
jgi:hypothetical protein